MADVARDMTLADLAAAFGDGTLTVLHRPEWMEPQHLAWLHLANAGDVNAAISFAEASITGQPNQRHNWMWHLGYDNRAALTNLVDQTEVITVISLDPAHALALAALQAMARQ
jgi:hypothetical protein